MNKKTSSLPRVGLVGISGYGRVHLDLIRKAHGRGLITFSAVVVINAEEEAETVKEFQQEGIRVYHAFDSFIASERGRLDLCFIPTGIHLHAPMTVAAMHAGMNVLVEKPLAGSVEQVDWVIDSERETGKFAAVGFQDMYLEETRRLKHRLLEGAIGELKSIRFMGLWPRPKSYYSRNQWTGKLVTDGLQALDSPLNNGFAHFVNLSLFLAGTGPETMASAVLQDAELIRAHTIESFDTGVIRAVSTEGVQFWFGASHACSIQMEPVVQIVGTAGRAVWRYDDRCELFRKDGESEEWAIPLASTARWQMTKLVIRKLVDPSSPISTASAARELTTLIEAAHKSTSIKVVNPSRIDWVFSDTGIEGDTIPAIRGLPEALERAFDTGSTLSNSKLNLDQAEAP